MRSLGRSRQQGFATVWAIAWIFVCLTVAWVGVLLAVGAAKQHHLDGSADLAALSGAIAQAHGRDACLRAEVVAAANSVTVASCRVEGDDVALRVEARADLPFGLTVRLRSAARAGPG
ncbi:MAG: Rv3654c family TadE-like protein [Nocardioidaceae bacterium]